VNALRVSHGTDDKKMAILNETERYVRNLTQPDCLA
jgi:hypothetical protein